MSDSISNQANVSPNLKRPLEGQVFMDEIIPAKKMVEETATLSQHNAITGTLTEVHFIPENVVGLVIGKAGSEIKRISAMSECRLQMDPDNTSQNGMRGCTIEGSATAILVAKQMINQLVENRQSTSTQPSQIVGEQTVDIMIPADKCGLVIGKSGETIKNLQEQSGCRIQMIQESQAITGHPKPLRIVGLPNAIEVATQLVNKVLNSAASGNILLNKMPINNVAEDIAIAKGEVIVPRAAAGMIIGKGGEVIKRLANETKTKIQFKPDDDPNSDDRCAIIMGSRDNIYLATERITEIVNKVVRHESVLETFYMHVPANKAGLVIGKGGETIRQIEAESGASCGLAKNVEHKDDERVFEVRGTSMQINHATHLVRIKVGDVAPNTPIPAMVNNNTNSNNNMINNNNNNNNNSNQMYQAAMFQHQQTLMHSYQQPQSPQAQMYVNTYGMMTPTQGNVIQPQQAPAQVWKPTSNVQMIGQSGDQAYQQPTQSLATVVTPKECMTPSINPITGMPDYSAHWAAYYRSIGLMEQAAMVENQMKRSSGVQLTQSGELDIVNHQQKSHQFPTNPSIGQ